MPLIYKTPHQKIFVKKEDLNLLLLKILNLLIYKKINLPNILDLPSSEENLPRFIKTWTQPDAIQNIKNLSFTRTSEINNLESLGSIRLQTPEDGKSLMNYFNIRISIGFKVSDLTNIFEKLTIKPTIANPFLKGAVPSANEIPTNEFLFCYINMWPYAQTWKLTISKGDSNYHKYNILAQDLVSDYFQSEIYTPKPDYIEGGT